MSCDKNNIATWIRYRKELCSKCIGTCCTMPVEVKLSDIIRLGLCDESESVENSKKIANSLIKQGIVSSYRDKTGIFTLVQQSNEDCYYLDSKTRLCKVYEKRPDVCRKFPTEMGRKIGCCPYIPKKVD